MPAGNLTYRVQARFATEQYQQGRDYICIIVNNVQNTTCCSVIQYDYVQYRLHFQRQTGLLLTINHTPAGAGVCGCN